MFWSLSVCPAQARSPGRGLAGSDEQEPALEEEDGRPEQGGGQRCGQEAEELLLHVAARGQSCLRCFLGVLGRIQRVKGRSNFFMVATAFPGSGVRDQQ